MDWKDLNKSTLEVMEMLGNFGPTIKVKDKLIKGYTYDFDGGGKTYWSSDDLRDIASACIEVANWLDQRASAEEDTPK